mgnify:CR=1 FL=1
MSSECQGSVAAVTFMPLTKISTLPIMKVEKLLNTGPKGAVAKSDLSEARRGIRQETKV